MKLLRLNGGHGPMVDRRNAVGTPRFGEVVSGGPAVVPVVAFWGCWVGAGSVSAMKFSGGEVWKQKSQSTFSEPGRRPGSIY